MCPVDARLEWNWSEEGRVEVKAGSEIVPLALPNPKLLKSLHLGHLNSFVLEMNSDCSSYRLLAFETALFLSKRRFRELSHHSIPSEVVVSIFESTKTLP